MNVFTGECIHVSLPILRRRHVLGLTAGDGLLVLCRKVGVDTVQLLNPFTRELVDLPDATTLTYNPEGFRALSAAVTDDSTVVLHHRRCSVAVAKPLDERWTQLKLKDTIMSTTLFAGRFYCATAKNILEVELETMAGQPPRVEVAADYYQVDGGVAPCDLLRLVDNGGELTLAHRLHAPYGDPRHGKCKVYRVDLYQGKVELVPRLGGRAVLIGGDDSDRVLSVPASVSPAIGADTVYICDCYDEEAGQVKSVACHRLDGSIEDGCRRKRPCSILDSLSCYVAAYRVEMDSSYPNPIRIRIR
ncbi:hypothetical protein ACP70R_005521 [Stipagrostis hirtigluma subsp. patula]